MFVVADLISRSSSASVLSVCGVTVWRLSLLCFTWNMWKQCCLKVWCLGFLSRPQGLRRWLDVWWRSLFKLVIRAWLNFVLQFFQYGPDFCFQLLAKRNLTRVINVITDIYFSLSCCFISVFGVQSRAGLDSSLGWMCPAGHQLRTPDVDQKM